MYHLTDCTFVLHKMITGKCQTIQINLSSVVSALFRKDQVVYR
jgi:hypothetical protein